MAAALLQRRLLGSTAGSEAENRVASLHLQCRATETRSPVKVQASPRALLGLHIAAERHVVCVRRWNSLQCGAWYRVVASQNHSAPWR